MEKVTKLKASKNLDVPKPKGNLLANPSFTSFDNCVLLEMAASLGISLGSDCKLADCMSCLCTTQFNAKMMGMLVQNAQLMMS